MLLFRASVTIYVPYPPPIQTYTFIVYQTINLCPIDGITSSSNNICEWLFSVDVNYRRMIH